jgi:DNA-binding beta-propeller fold protein YncE
LVDIFAPDVGAEGAAIASVAVGAHPGSAENIAVDPIDDSLYVAETSFGNGIAKYVSDHGDPPTYTYEPTFSPSPLLTTPKGMAVDPVSRDLLVVDEGSQQIFRLSAADGSTISSFAIPAGALGIAVGPEGRASNASHPPASPRGSCRSPRGATRRPSPSIR